MAEVSRSGRLRTHEALPTDNGESVSVSAGGSEHCPGVREEHGEAAHLAATERQHGLVGDPTDLQQRDSGDTKQQRQSVFMSSQTENRHEANEKSHRGILHVTK